MACQLRYITRARNFKLVYWFKTERDVTGNRQPVAKREKYSEFSYTFYRLYT